MLAMLTDTYNAIDAVIAPPIFSALTWVGVDVPPCPWTQSFPLTSSPTPAVLFIVGYLITVSVWYNVLKMRFKNSSYVHQEPKWLKSVVLFHNVFLVVLSFYMCVRTIYEAYYAGYKVWGTGMPKSFEIGMANVTWLFYTSKFYEFLDTFIMLFKGNLRQVSYLHVYHHMTIPFIQWILMCFSPGGENYFSQAVNSWVHVVMYTYYCLAAMLPKDPVVRKRWLWWGKHVTKMQMTQFAVNMSHGIFCMYSGIYPLGIGRIYTWYMVSLLFFFGNFYVQKFIAPAPAKKEGDINAKLKGA